MTTVFGHFHLLVTSFAHYLHLLRICTLTPLPSLAQLRISRLHTYTCQSAALEKSEVPYFDHWLHKSCYCTMSHN